MSQEGVPAVVMLNLPVGKLIHRILDSAEGNYVGRVVPELAHVVCYCVVEVPHVA